MGFFNWKRLSYLALHITTCLADFFAKSIFRACYENICGVKYEKLLFDKMADYGGGVGRYLSSMSGESLVSRSK